MTTQSASNLVWSVIAALSLPLAGCNLSEVTKANEKVDQANELSDESKKLSKKADALKAAAVDARDDEVARKAGGKKCKAKYDEAIEKLDEAATVMKEASKLRVSKEFGKYLSLKSENLSKISEGLDAEAQMCVELSKEPDEAKLAKLVKKVKDASAEADELSEKAEKIRDDNPSQFQK